MCRIKEILILGIIILLIGGCSIKKNVNIGNNQPDVDYSKTAIDLFGKKLCGKYQDVINDIYELPMISFIRYSSYAEVEDLPESSDNESRRFSHIVEFCGVPCGMNVDYYRNQDGTISVNQIIFLTSKTDERVIKTVLTAITNHYGDANIYEETYNNYSWFLDNSNTNQTIRARWHHSDRGGWTVYFYNNYN